MSKSVILIITLTFMLITFIFGGYAAKPSPNSAADSGSVSASKSFTITDMLGRSIPFMDTAKRVVAIGPGALRLYCYVGGTSRLVGIEQIEKKYPTGRSYVLANSSLTELEVIGPGGAQ